MSAIRSRTRIFFLVLGFLAFYLIGQSISAQTRNLEAIFTITTFHLAVPTRSPEETKYAHPVARLVGSSDRAEVFRPFRPRIVILDPSQAALAHGTAPEPAVSATT